MYRIKQVAIVFIVVIINSLSLYSQENILHIVPEPQEFSFTDSKFNYENQTISVQYFANKYPQMKIVINDLISETQDYCSIITDTKIYSLKKILIGISSENEEFAKIISEYSFSANSINNFEGYNLIIDENRIIISGNHQKGLFYGLQTLKQLFRGSINQNYLRGVIISDWPSYKYRAISDDISRGPLPTMSYMKYQVRRLAEMKVNTIIHYVEHVVKTKSHPEFAPEEGSLTIDEWKEIADYAWNYNITVIGGFQSFGHFNNILSIPEYAHLGESGSLISPVNPESYIFLENIYAEMIPVFHSEFFNINCDETFDLGKGASKKLVDSIGYGEVYFKHIMKLYDIVKKYDKRIIMWGDILMQYPKLLDKLPSDVLVGTWNYDAKNTFDNFINPFKNSEHEFWVVPGVLNSRRIYPDFDKAFKNIKIFIEEGYEAGASGVLNCFWDDGSTGLFSNDWYGAAYGADKSWKAYSNDRSFDIRYALGSLEANNLFFMEAIRKINELRFLELTDGMTDKFLFVKLLPDSGKNHKISLADLEKAKTIVVECQELLNKTELGKYEEDRIYLQFIVDLYSTLINERYILIEAAKQYSSAEKIVMEQPFIAREKMVKAINDIAKIIMGQHKIKKSFQNLWLKENHLYALDWITDKYSHKINEFKNVHKLLLQSLKKLDSSLPILTTSDVRLAITELPGKYFTEWMMINPISVKEKNNPSEIDYLSGMGGEASANPKVTQEFSYDNETYRWRRIVSETPDIIYLNKIFKDEDENNLTYAFANISIEEKKVVSASIGFAQKIQVFINGAEVFNRESDKLQEDAFLFDLPLEKGKNNLLIKISQKYAEWGFSFRLPNSRVRNSKNRYRIINSEN